MENRLIKPIRASAKPLLLKDHLLDDMSSCSSNGFKSFPRRQCCSTVRFLHDFDRQNNKLLLQQKAYVSFTKPPPPNPARSALQSVISAVKRLQFGGARSPEKRRSSTNNSFLPRSFSRKLFRRGSFWKRKPERKEIEPWKSFDQLLKEDSQPSDRSDTSITTAEDGNKSYSCSGSDSTAPDSANSSSEVNSKSTEVKNDAVAAVAAVAAEEGGDDHGVGATNDDVSAESTTSNSSSETKKQWGSDQEKEQLSPVSILDCPFEDDDEVSSPFQHRLARMEGTRKKLLKKIQKFECLAKLEPTNLSRRFASLPADSSDDESFDSPLPHSSSSTDEEQEEGNEEEKALELLDQLKTNMPSYGLHHKVDKLMLDFFREMIANDHQHSLFHEELVEIAQGWIHGRKPFDLFMEWEVEKNRQAYVKDMERSGEWKALDQENEVVLELGNEVFDALMNEMVMDFMS